jgi:hypothetical protein
MTTGGQTVTVRKEGEQTSFSAPIMSPSKAAVGAQAMFPNCCTSYDIPLQLVVYAAGKVHRFTGRNLPIFEWPSSAVEHASRTGRSRFTSAARRTTS